MATTEWTYEGYWNVVLGAHRSACDVVREFNLDSSDGLDEWLGQCEGEARVLGGIGREAPESWAGYHAMVLKALEAVLEEKQAEYYRTVYRVEGRDENDQWSWMHVGDSERACTFTSRDDAQQAIDELVNRHGWDETSMRVKEIEPKG